jgi:hypothetical protein
MKDELASRRWNLPRFEIQPKVRISEELREASLALVAHD